MPSFGRRSRERLDQCHPDLQRVMERAIKLYDFTILTGHRHQVEQDAAYAAGTSGLRWPHSKHNRSPSLAVDIAPWPINWDDLNRFYFLAGAVMSAAQAEGVRLRWGGDWDMDYDFGDEKFRDLPHFEIVG